MKILSLAVGLLFSGVVGALEIGDTVLCIDEENIGYRWHNGEWEDGSFANDKHIVKKINNDSFMCRVEVDEYNKFAKDSGNLRVTKACYNVKYFQDKESVAYNQACTEARIKGGDGKYELVEVSCENIRFQPNGRFVFSATNTELSEKPESGRKNTIHLSHGGCSKI